MPSVSRPPVVQSRRVTELSPEGNSMTARAILDQFAFFREAPEGFQEEVLAASGQVNLPAGFYPFQEGSRCEGFAFVGKGDVRVFKGSSGGREITLYHVGPGETCLLTLNAAMGNSSYPASAVVEDPVEAVAVPAESFRCWVRQQDEMRAFVFEQMAYRISDLMALIHDVVFQRMDRRVAAYLLSRRSTARRDAALELTHGAIATELGSAREVVSRVLKELEREGAVELGRGSRLPPLRRREGPAGSGAVCSAIAVGALLVFPTPLDASLTGSRVSAVSASSPKWTWTPIRPRPGR